MASEQSSLEVLKRPVVAALTPKMSDAAIRAAFRICLSVRSLTYCRCGAKGYEAYHWVCAEYVQNSSTQKPLIAGYLPMSSFGKNRTKKMMKRETAKKKRAKKKKTTRATQSDHRMSPVVRLKACNKTLSISSKRLVSAFLPPTVEFRWILDAINSMQKGRHCFREED